MTEIDINPLLDDMKNTLETHLKGLIEKISNGYKEYESTHKALYQLPFIKDMKETNDYLSKELQLSIERENELLVNKKSLLKEIETLKLTIITLSRNAAAISTTIQDHPPNNISLEIKDEIHLANDMKCEIKELYTTVDLADEDEDIDEDEDEEAAEEPDEEEEEQEEEEEEEVVAEEEQEEEEEVVDEEEEEEEEVVDEEEEEEVVAEEEEEEEEVVAEEEPEEEEEVVAEEEPEEEEEVVAEEEPEEAVEEEEEEQEDEDEDEEELYEIEYQGKQYYVSGDDDIYEKLDDEDVGEDIIGRLVDGKPVFNK